MGSEDFGALGSTGVPVVFWMLNASPMGDKDGPVNHSPLFQIDESAMRVGVRALTAATLSQLANERFRSR
jgi:amidohydrolase